MKKKILICVAGPTAAGKTALAIQVAKRFNTEIISADSRQFFKEISIGTAKPSAEELAQVKHHFIGNISIDHLYSAGDFERDALSKLEEIFSEHEVAVMVGGSGLYIKAVCEGLDDMPRADEELRAALQQQFDEHGIAPLQQRLKQLDPDKYATTDLQNTQRVMRAIEVAEQNKKGFTKRTERIQRDFEVIKFGIDLPREELYQRINARVDAMVQAGLIDEAREVYPLRHLNALQTVGYTELFDHFENKHSLDKAIELIKQHTRNFAKRQMTWCRRDEGIVWIGANEVERVDEFVGGRMREVGD